MNNINLLTAEYYPDIPRSEIIGQCNFHISLKDFSSFGKGFAVASAEIANALKEKSFKGLYKCVFPKGVTGHLAEFKDGTGSLGTIINENGIAGQARFLPAKGAGIAMAVDPVTLVIAVTVMSIDSKLSSIQENQNKILHFLNQDKESKLEGSVNTLADILEQYRYNISNETWKSGKLTAVTNIKDTAESNIIFYRKNITEVMKKLKGIHNYADADKLKANLEHDFKYYQLSVYIKAYSSFLEVILSGNYSAEYLNNMSKKITKESYQYRMDYSQCYEQLESYMKGTVESVTLGGIGSFTKGAGKVIASVPILNKAPFDEALIAAGKAVKNLGSGHGKSAMKKFSNNQYTGIKMFTDGIEAINEMCNQPVELFFDKDEAYICY